ncbi:MAG TPA: extracellular solute-binding protein [Geminicoccaceae bacterium]|nr:extracellular solute-binding protein [Geminicoccus sp.]HMU49444.1 extracellular solute-binding protein [Geminicoccaceae bacterium]
MSGRCVHLGGTGLVRTASRRSILGGMAAGATALAVGMPSGARAHPTNVDVAKAKAEGMLTLYFSLDQKIASAIMKAFQEKYGIEVEYFRAGPADLAAKIFAEADVSAVVPDMLDISDLSAIAAMKERGLLMAHRSPVADSVPGNLRDPDEMWIADRLSQSVLQYSTREFNESTRPNTWADVAKPAYKNRVAIGVSPNGDGAWKLYLLAELLGWDYLKRLADSNVLRVATPQLMTQVVESGERGIGLAINDNIAWRSKADGKPTDYLYPAEGVPAEAGACCLMAGSKHPNAAALFYDWWMGDEGQALLVAGGKYSSRTSLPPPAGMQSLAGLKLMSIDPQKFRRERTEILQKMSDIFGGEWGI